jgi:hypothetical protein
MAHPTDRHSHHYFFDVPVRAGIWAGEKAFMIRTDSLKFIIFVKTLISRQLDIAGIATFFIFVLYMKKLALIILMAVYALAIAGAGIAPVLVGEHVVCSHTDGFPAVNAEGNAGKCGGETCHAGYIGFTVKEHQQAAGQFHFSSRHSIKDAEGNLPIVAPLIQQARLFTADNCMPGASVPAYILHCVYRL